MSAASVERPHGDRPLIAEAGRLMERNPGYRVEIIGGKILVSPPPDGPHGNVLTDLLLLFASTGLHGVESRLIQGIGLWLPTGTEDYAIPDLSLVDADYEEHHVENNCYEPACFRLVLEVTSSNWKADLRDKVKAYAGAKIPVYMIVDRKYQRLHVLTDPAGDDYENHRPYSPGEIATLPGSIGAEVTLDVGRIIKAGQTNAN
ncbi:Uma2 family endonuclease [Streptomyces sp. HUCO-GS316]|uniref:Uma2 family endonuclease n=1 Tax=Streptomyces sp. HUCO-GS316 TaxID=2692198 RepID=UPI0013685E80|nr:Uma2 family endonuclease [Streptomyces sp. HUCO-GS316]MXM67237.1 Uma2 family endonuclease [Streptomyces sp. HUCO-GS316]